MYGVGKYKSEYSPKSCTFKVWLLRDLSFLVPVFPIKQTLWLSTLLWVLSHSQRNPQDKGRSSSLTFDLPCRCSWPTSVRSSGSLQMLWFASWHLSHTHLTPGDKISAPSLLLRPTLQRPPWFFCYWNMCSSGIVAYSHLAHRSCKTLSIMRASGFQWQENVRNLHA